MEYFPMNILHIDTSKFWRGGEQQLFYLASGLKKFGYNQIIVCQPDTLLFKYCQESQICPIPIRMRGEWDVLSALRIKRIVDKYRIQIIHTHCAHGHTLGLIAKKLSSIKPKLIVSRRVQFHIHKNLLSQYKYKRGGVDKILAVADKVKKTLIEDGILEEKIEVVYEGTDLSRFNKKDLEKTDYLYSELGLKKNRPIVGIIAALAPHKDHLNFLTAGALVKKTIPDVQLLVVGEGKLYPELIRLTQQLNITDSVIFTGFRTDIPEILSILDVFVISSYSEGLCTSIIEAQSCGVPVVATNVSGIPEVVQDGVNGLLVPSKNPPELAKKILEILNDKSLDNRLINKAKETVKNFDKDIMIKKTRKIYQIVCFN